MMTERCLDLTVAYFFSVHCRKLQKLFSKEINDLRTEPGILCIISAATLVYSSAGMKHLSHFIFPLEHT